MVEKICVHENCDYLQINQSTASSVTNGETEAKAVAVVSVNTGSLAAANTTGVQPSLGNSGIIHFPMAYTTENILFIQVWCQNPQLANFA